MVDTEPRAIPSRSARSVVEIPAPSATGAAGEEVPVDLEVSGDSIVLTLDPGPETPYPVLLDPAFVNEEWNWATRHDSLAAWTGSDTTEAYRPLPYMFWNPGYPGLDITSGFPGSAPSGSDAAWVHSVPRYAEDIAHGYGPPKSWIYELYAEGVMFMTNGNTSAYPVLLLGLVDPNNGWAVSGSHYGTQGDMTSWANHFAFINEKEMSGVKLAEMNLATFENEARAKLRHAYIANAVTVIADTEAPEILQLTPPTQWMNTTSSPIGYSFADGGLGVRAAMIAGPGESSAHSGWGAEFGCTGTSSSPCPRQASSSESGRPALNYSPAELPTGIDNLTVTLGDATWVPSHEVTKVAKVKIDHAAPSLSLSGSITEQATLGTARPQYTLKYAASDGSEEAPTPISSFGTEGTAAGQFKHPAGVAVDASGNVWVADENNNRIERQTTKGEYTTYGTLGSGNGQLNHPTGIDIDSSEDVWVADTGNNRIEEFNPKGEYVRAFGSAGSTDGKLSSPQGIAVDTNGDVWVADTGNNRIEEFSSSGTFLGAFGTKGSGSGQLSEPAALDIGPGGNVWVADTGNNRVEEFSEAGEFIAAYGSAGTGNGQFNRPGAIDVDTKGNVWVADQGNNRVEQLSERGEYLGKFGSAGSGSGQLSLSAPIGLASNSAGELWVTDAGNSRVESWNAPQGTQSGVHSVAVKVDGKVVAEPTLACKTGGCPLVGEWTLQSGNYTAGSHTVEVVATDGVGLSATQKQTIALNPPMPTLSLSGTATEQASLGATRPRYVVRLNASAELGNGLMPSTAPTYTRSIGSSGSGEAQLSHPADVALTATGNLWVVDENNNRVEELSPKGTYLGQIGATGTTEEGRLSHPTAVAVDSKGNLWIADGADKRVVEFSEAGKFVRSFGGAGTGEGKFGTAGPEGIAVDSKGDVWVSDPSDSRLEEFSAEGKFIKAVGAKGGGQGQLSEPTSIEIAPNNNVFVTDWGNNRVEVYNEAGEFVRQFGSEGSGQRQFKHPDGIAIDPSGNVWVGDQNNQRFQEFTQSGRYLTEFGTAGSGSGQFSLGYPAGLAVDPQGVLWVTDPGNNRIERWREPSRSLVKTEVLFDGTQVESGEVSCTTESCSGALEWTLESSAYTAGKHTVVAKATDGFGNTTSKTLNIEVQRDMTKPGLEVGGELASVPEGWVQQESYGLHAAATDPGGYGVTSLAFKIDGATVASTSQSCPAGGCETSLSKSISMAPYSGGAHQAEAIATDGAGNQATKRWTINVDPEGHVSTAEATATLEAVEETSSANLVGESEEEEGIEGTAPGLGIQSSEGALVATGTDVPLTIEPAAGGGFTAEVPEASAFEVCGQEGAESNSGEEEPEEEVEPQEPEEECEAPLLPEGNEEGMDPISVVPLGVKEGATVGNLVEENAVVVPNTGSAADTVIRPMTDGGMSFAEIRDETAPEEYSWRVELNEDQTLRLESEQEATVYYNDHTPAFSITAEPAHDAVGTEVPTSLSVDHGDIVTLTVHYKAGHEGAPFVYPVVAGAGWQGGFQQTEVLLAEPSEEVEEEESEELEAALHSGSAIVGIATFGPPEEVEPVSKEEAAVMELGPAEPNAKGAKRFRFDICHAHLVAGDPPPLDGPDDHARALEMKVLHFHCRDPEYGGNYWRVTVQGKFHYVFHQRVWLNWMQWGCYKTGGDEIHDVLLRHCEAFFPNGAHYPSAKPFKGPIETVGEWRFPYGKGQFADEAKPNCLTAGGWLFPNPRKGDAEGLYEEPLEYQRPRWVEVAEDCPAISP